MSALPVTRSAIRLHPDPTRVIVKPFAPGEFSAREPGIGTSAVLQRALALPEAEVSASLRTVRARFGDRHPQLDRHFESGFERVAHVIDDPGSLSPERQLLIGAYFVHEYSVEAAAITNPSIVPAPDQSGLEHGQLRFVMSARAIGEGHRSSLEFRVGVVNGDGTARLDEPGRHLVTGSSTADGAISFPLDSDLSERVLYPRTAEERNGIEDARFVRFIDDDGDTRYLATYTAFDGSSIRPRLLESVDCGTFRAHDLVGEAARDKGLALFPRRVGGRYAALTRYDDESNHLVYSDDLLSWRRPRRLQVPLRAWELIKLGNCGSPIETDAGWLVITHAVGPFREYVLGAILLALDDPSRVVGSLDEPLLAASDDERDGYVPNVVYSCGSLIHQGQLVIPYGFSDRGVGIATVTLEALLGRLVAGPTDGPTAQCIA